jgi:hypothetical protein
MDNYTIAKYLRKYQKYISTHDFDTFYRMSHGYFDSNKGLLKPRLMPLLEVKLSSAKEDYFENLHRVWEKMDKRSGADREP